MPAATIARPLARCEAGNRAAQPRDFGTGLADRAAGRCSNLDDALVHLGLDLFAQNHLPAFEDLRDIRTQFARFRIDDLVFFLDAEREREIRRHGIIDAHGRLQAAWVQYQPWPGRLRSPRR